MILVHVVEQKAESIFTTEADKYFNPRKYIHGCVHWDLWMFMFPVQACNFFISVSNRTRNRSTQTSSMKGFNETQGKIKLCK